MKTLEELLTEYPNLEYEDGWLYENSKSDCYYLTDDKGLPLDADSLIADFFDGESVIVTNEFDPRNDLEETVSGETYIKSMFDNNYQEAFNFIIGK